MTDTDTETVAIKLGRLEELLKQARDQSVHVSNAEAVEAKAKADRRAAQENYQNLTNEIAALTRDLARDDRVAEPGSPERYG